MLFNVPNKCSIKKLIEEIGQQKHWTFNLGGNSNIDENAVLIKVRAFTAQ